MVEERIGPILFLDLETTGLNPEIHNVLEIAGVWFDIHEHTIEPAFHFFVKERLKMHCDPIAMEINKIDLNFVREHGLYSKDAIIKMRQAFDEKLGPNHGRVVLGGHNVKFDISFMMKLYEAAGEQYEQDFDYHCFSTDTLMMFLMMKGKRQEEFPKLKRWVEANGCKLDREHGHSALKDITATVESLKKFLENWEINETNSK